MASAQFQDDAPVGEINTTPLIDVMLVLLIMFIITIPIQSHSVPIDLPGAPREIVPEVLERNKLVVTRDGATLWNGAAINPPVLRTLLQRMATIEASELQFEPAPEARYEVVNSVLAKIKRANVASMGFVGNERYAQF